ncbi:MAG: hypothetical protein M3162_03345 [Thermoproteota archaeon]|nr:hypothetical protein [Thermoproteota archaeon]
MSFGIGSLTRTIPVVLNFPYPVGYDSVNYYLPVLYTLSDNGSTFTISFPVYISLVYFLSEVFQSDIYYSFILTNIFLYGFFATSIFLLSKNILNQSFNRSLLYSVFVVFQLSVLRISWDLYRDLLSLVLFHIFLLIIGYIKGHQNMKRLDSVLSNASIFIISIVTVLSDRMIGILLILSSFIFSILQKNKFLFFSNMFLFLAFIIYFLAFDNITYISKFNFLDVLFNPEFDRNSFSQVDVAILFLSLYCFILPFFLIGFIKSKAPAVGAPLILKIPLILSVLFSFSWIFIPNYGHLVPERWVIISGIYFSIFGLYGFFYLVDSFSTTLLLKKIFSLIFLSSFVIYGLMFLALPYEESFTIPSLFKSQTENLFPLSMSFNTMDTNKNRDLINSIDWINTNTSLQSVIVGTKHWKGWFSLFLDHPRKYLYVEDLVPRENNGSLGKQEFSLSSILKNNFTHLCYSNGDKRPYDPLSNRGSSSIYFIMPGDPATLSIPSHLFSIAYKSDSYVIYDLTKQICSI